MRKSYINLKYQEFKEKFNNFFIQKKKVKAIENFTSVADLPVEVTKKVGRHISYIKDVMNEGFLDNEEETFLNHIIAKLEIDAFSWAHKTKYIKAEMARMMEARRPVKEYQMMFPIDRLTPAVNVPVELLVNSKSQKVARA